MIITLIIFTAALIALIKSSDALVFHSIRLAQHFRMSEFFVGFILIAIATSLPELAISAFAAFSNAPGIGVGNVLGASIADLLLIMGIVIFFHSVVLKGKKLAENAQIMVFITFIPLVLLLSGTITLVHGIVFILLFAAYCLFSFKEKISLEIRPSASSNVFKSAFIFCLSAFLLVVSSSFIVSSTLEIAGFLGISNSLIAVSIISIGTTLPELASAISAVKAKKYQMAFGDLVGSVIVNITLVLGISAIAAPIAFKSSIIYNAIFFLILAELMIVAIAGIQKKIDRRIGIGLILAYALFLLVEFGGLAF